VGGAREDRRENNDQGVLSRSLSGAPPVRYGVKKLHQIKKEIEKKSLYLKEREDIKKLCSKKKITNQRRKGKVKGDARSVTTQLLKGPMDWERGRINRQGGGDKRER